jgi:formylglycine-generating enzyme required for sulfatase activity
MCVPAGAFSMGSENGNDGEKPVHIVTLGAYWIDQTEVTNARFAQFIEETGYQTLAEKEGWGLVWTPSTVEQVNGADWKHPQGPQSSISGMEQHPVVQVSWDDAVAYCQWAGHRLPTEAEWEKAARGTDGWTYPWGESKPAGNRLNFADKNLQVDWANKSIDDGYQLTAPVGNYPDGASPYGVLDMAGNVSEWVADWYADSYYGSQTEGYNPLGPNLGEYRVLRGGSWLNNGWVVRTSVRTRDYPSNRYDLFGFRCSRSP